MSFLPPDAPLYNHTLPQIEQWLKDQGCQQNEAELHCWHVKRPTWQADLSLDVEQLTVRYIEAGENHQDILRSFKYSLSREDIEQAVFAGP
ncbi:hypothetical protein NIES37_22740 [Tolypothrix tenuis PCC 7101]|uniref:DUF3143 domain-containing protein n=1 Tax=Tolypothrix tenuis PCC 7101 TaxID=231146 RepID=A0A1Z4MXW1_9CYAN|nr:MULTISPECIES: DUF3143 domain-containing protein [unclassified Tolypothrix]MBD2236813.1 DUF3143 domain-containing protein [Aulosira sp. FACHB-113]BAY88095.1 hypothetical protein NIES3275_00700 [Microchaete diplosiphon NIES-3275]BAY98324.1 hypothetical protein NIES37_22740 [Tolypothrix tenuis PCC 7101]BAZ77757.1 hypothetical protein NIES50_63880 [Aulosira laxa NIES-50]EKE97498.1 hypothetical protein FDUTEX481_04874 [Tolypothrix sp. PCC 7601]